jgi:hypothetical protein
MAMSWNDRMLELVNKNYTPAQRQKMETLSGEAQVKINNGWAALFKDIEALGANPDPKTPKAQELAKRAYGLMNDFAQGDKALLKSVVAMNRDISRDQDMAQNMPGQQHWPLIDQVLTDLKMIDRA